MEPHDVRRAFARCEGRQAVHKPALCFSIEFRSPEILVRQAVGARERRIQPLVALRPSERTRVDASVADLDRDLIAFHLGAFALVERRAQRLGLLE